jgi:hypothetical protein
VLKNKLAAAILDLFIEKMNRNNAIVCSYQTIQELTGYSRASVGKAMKVLRDDKWVQSVKIGTAHSYVVNSAAFWTTYANGKKYSVFHATVIASESEQEQAIANMQSVELRRVPILTSGEQATITDEALPPPDQLDIPV